MNLQATWLVKDRIIQVVAIGDITVNDIDRLSESVIGMMSQTDAPAVHIVLDEGKTTSLPKSLAAFSNVAQFLRHDKTGWFFIYGNTDRTSMANFLGSMVVQITKVRHRRFETLKECLDFLIVMDPTLPSVEEILGQ